MLTEGYFSTAAVPAGIYGEGEQPTAMTCNYERLAGKEQPYTKGSDGRVGCQGWLNEQ